MWLASKSSMMAACTSRTRDGRVEDFDLVMYATGRKAKLDNLGIETLGIELTDKGAVKVDENYRTVSTISMPWVMSSAESSSHPLPWPRA